MNLRIDSRGCGNAASFPALEKRDVYDRRDAKDEPDKELSLGLLCPVEQAEQIADGECR